MVLYLISIGYVFDTLVWEKWGVFNSCQFYALQMTVVGEGSSGGPFKVLKSLFLLQGKAKLVYITLQLTAMLATQTILEKISFIDTHFILKGMCPSKHQTASNRVLTLSFKTASTTSSNLLLKLQFLHPRWQRIEVL